MPASLQRDIVGRGAGLLHWAPKGEIRICGGSDKEAEVLTRFEIKFQIKPFLGITIGKILMSRSLSIHICKIE